MLRSIKRNQFLATLRNQKVTSIFLCSRKYNKVFVHNTISINLTNFVEALNS